MDSGMPNWEEVKTFAAVARERTTRGAARSLQVHHTTVGRRLEQLETSMKTRLFDRHPDGYVLTTSGEKLFAIVCSFKDQLEHVAREVSETRDSLSGRLRVTMPGPFATHVLAPQLHRFTTAYPDLEIELIPSYGLLDLSRMEADVAIRMDNNPPTGLVGRRLFRYRQAPYATRGYLQEHDLSARPEEARLLGWEEDGETFPEWMQGTGCESVPAWGYFPEPGVQLAAAKAGLGIALLPCLIADQDKELVRATTEPPIEARDIWLVTHRDLASTSRVRVFLEFAEEVLRSLEPEMLGIRGKKGR